MSKHFAVLTTLALALAPAAMCQVQVDFETIADFTLGPEDYQLAGDHGGTFTAAGAVLHGYHHVDPPWEWWGGFGASNRTAVAGDDVLHQYTAAPGGDHTTGPGGTYALGYSDWESGLGALIEFPQATAIDGAWFANVAWTAEYIAANYGPGDYYHLRVTAYNAAMSEIDSAVVDLTDNADWTWSAFGWDGVAALGITMETSDDFTPLYFALDDINVPEPATAVLLAAGAAPPLLRRRRRGA